MANICTCARRYAFVFSNPNKERIRVVVSIDGEEQGRWVIGKGVVVLERPASAARLFTLLAAKSEEAKSVGADPAKSTNGLVKISITKEKPRPYMPYLGRGNRGGGDVSFGFESDPVRSLSSGIPPPVPPPLMDSSASLASGITALTGHSDQVFEETTFDRDPKTHEAIIKFKLMVGDPTQVQETKFYYPLNGSAAAEPNPIETEDPTDD
jgi:hypothetical protein